MTFLKRVLPQLLLCLAAGCSGPQPVSSAAPACAVDKVADVPLRMEHGFVVAPASIERRAATMLVDTGSERTLITPGAAETFGLQPDPHAHTRLVGVGGTIMADNAHVQSFGLGGMETMDRSYAVQDLPGSGLMGGGPDGLIGADWLRDYDVDLDVGAGRMTLYRVDGCADDHVPWTGRHDAIRTMQVGTGLVLLKVVVNGTPVTALLDSGADLSVLSEQAAARLGVTAGELARDPTGRASGVDGRIAVTHLHHFASVQVGAERTDDMALVIGPLQAGGGAEMLLGANWLRLHRVWIDYRDHMVFVQVGAA